MYVICIFGITFDLLNVYIPNTIKKLFKMRPPFTFKPLPNSVEDVSGIFEITELWRPHFKQLFNCIRDIDIQQITFFVRKYSNVAGD